MKTYKKVNTRAEEPKRDWKYITTHEGVFKHAKTSNADMVRYITLETSNGVTTTLFYNTESGCLEPAASLEGMGYEFVKTNEVVQLNVVSV